MKRILLIIVLALVPVIVSAQTFINADFSGEFPPENWGGADSHTNNWSASASNEAGGAAPELLFNWEPQFSGTTRFLSQQIDLTGVTQLFIEFDHMIDHYQGGYTVGVATRAGTGSWHVVWQIHNPSGSVGPETINQEITTADVGASDFQICWFFSGSSFNINNWFIDNISLYAPLDHDVKVKEIQVDPQYEPGAVFQPMALIQNFGLSDETFDVNCEITLNEVVVYNETITDISVDAGDTDSHTFPQSFHSNSDELYEITVTTLLEGDMEPANDSKSKIFNTYSTPRDMVVLEIGTGIWCSLCPSAAMAAEELVENNYNVAIVEYHGSSQTVTDPYENQQGIDRLTYYNISGFPTAVFDGVNGIVGGLPSGSMYTHYTPYVEERQQLKSAFDMDIFGTHTGNNYDIVVRVNKMAPITYENMVLHVALTQSNIQYNWQNLNHLEWVERLMLPTSNGSVLSFADGDVQDFQMSFVKDASWPEGDCELTAFVQNLVDKEVLQGTKKSLPDLVPVGIEDEAVALPTYTRLGDNYPNPFNPKTSINFALANSGAVQLEVFNILGQKVRTLVDGQMAAGNHTITWDSCDENGGVVASGAYFYRLTTDDYSSTKKMLLMK